MRPLRYPPPPVDIPPGGFPIYQYLDLVQSATLLAAHGITLAPGTIKRQATYGKVAGAINVSGGRWLVPIRWLEAMIAEHGNARDPKKIVPVEATVLSRDPVWPEDLAYPTLAEQYAADSGKDLIDRTEALATSSPFDLRATAVALVADQVGVLPEDLETMGSASAIEAAVEAELAELRKRQAGEGA
jgi:hypothetical protein